MLIKGDIEQKSTTIEHEDNDNEEDEEEDTTKRGIVQMKGAPERILDLCDRYLFKGEMHELTDEKREEIMTGILALGAKGERVLALAELVLDADKYDINCDEPVIEEKYDDSIDENYCKQDCVMINYNGEIIKIDIDLSKIPLDDDDDDDNGKSVTFENIKIKNIMKFIEKSSDERIGNLSVAAQRIAFSDYGIVDDENTLNELGIKRGSLLYLFKGPYIFSGGQSDDINIPFNRNEKEEGLVFIGLFSMIDPPRPGVPEAIEHCQSAGIKVIMVTGDHPITAKAIAEAVGIINEETKDNTLIYDSLKLEKEKENISSFDAIVVPGWELQSVLDKEPEHPQCVADFWNNVLNCDNIVFARTSPQQKLLIVSAVQERGSIVGVTGDGVNDSPALKKADIGIAMGITGTQVAKEAANMILLDDNFSTIITGIKQGRIIFDNLKKSISYSLGKNMPEVIPFVVYLAFGLPLPLTPLLLLCVDLGTDIMPSISLAMENKEFDIMQRKPRNPKHDKLGTIKLICMAELVLGVFAACGGMFGYFNVLHSYGFLPIHLITEIDRYSVFSFYGNEQRLRDAYYLWCFDPEITGHSKCYYYPNFYDGFVIHTYHNIPFPYYNQYQWYQWQINNMQYAKESKEYLIDITKNEEIRIKYKIIGNQLTMNQLNGKDNDGNICCNTQLKNGSINNQCQQTDKCKQEYLDWNTFLNNYWGLTQGNNTNYGIFEKFNDDIFISPVYYNRQCDVYDNFNIYMAPQKNQPPPFCDWITGETDPQSRNSFFPISTNSRTFALTQAQSAYLVAIVILQLSNLLTIKTRIASIFQQGMPNTFMNYAILFEIFLISFLIYIPFCNQIVGSSPLRFVFWTPSMPYAIAVLCYHEFRKCLIRKDKNKKNWITRTTLW